MLEQYFRHVLKQFGFDDVEKVLWSLGCSQGDGCSFTGYVDNESMGNLLPSFFPVDVKNALHRVGNLTQHRYFSKLIQEMGCGFSIEQSGRYVHEKTMTIDWDVDLEIASEEQGDLDDCQALADILLEYSQGVARKIEADGYKILDAFNQEEKEVWRFKTAKYLFRLFEIEEDPEDSFMSDWDEECLISTCVEMASGNIRITGLKAEVFLLIDIKDETCLEEYEPLAEATLGGISYQMGDRYYSTCRRDLISGLIFGVRESEEKSKTFPLAA